MAQDGSTKTVVWLGTVTHVALAGERRRAFWPLEMLMRRTIDVHFSMPLRAAPESLSSPVKHGTFEAFKDPTGTQQNTVFFILLGF